MADIERLGAGNPDGCLHGWTAAEKIGFYGTTPVIQPTGSFTTVAHGDSTNAIIDLLVEVRRSMVVLGLHTAA